MVITLNTLTRHGLAFGTILILSAAACTNDDPPPPASPDTAELVTVVGEVTSIEDAIPVDGGARIEVKTDANKTVLLRYGSGHTNPPPSQAHIDLYQVILKLEVGSRVRASGTPNDGAIALRQLTILP